MEVHIPKDAVRITWDTFYEYGTGTVWYDDISIIEQSSNINLFLNGSFEEQATGGNIPGWSKWIPGGNPTLAVVDNEAVDGKQSIYISGDSPDDRGAIVQSVNVEAGETYLLSYWAKTANVEAHGTGVTTRVQFKDSAGANTANMIYAGRFTGTTEWTQFTQTLKVPERTSNVKIEPILDQATGEVWFDNFVLEKLDASKPPEFTHFSVKLLDTGSTQLNWNVTYSNNVEFEIYRSAEEDFEPNAELLLDTTMGNHYVDRTTSLDKTYYYRVVLIDKSNNTSVTDAKEITVTQTSLPSIPEEFNSTTHIAGGVWLSWKLGETSRANTVRLYASDLPMDKAENQYFINEISANETTYVYGVTKTPKYYGILIIDADGGESEWITTELQRILPPVGDKITNLEHPYLFFTAEDIPAIKQTISNYEFAENALEVLVANADVAASAILDPKFQLPGKNDNLHDRLADQARDLSLAYLMTEKPEYRDAAIKILTEYGDHYAEYPLEGTYDGRLLYQTLNESGWVIDFAWAYDMMYQELSEVQRQKIEEYVFAQCSRGD